MQLDIGQLWTKSVVTRSNHLLLQVRKNPMVTLVVFNSSKSIGISQFLCLFQVWRVVDQNVRSIVVVSTISPGASTEEANNYLVVQGNHKSFIVSCSKIATTYPFLDSKHLNKWKKEHLCPEEEVATGENRQIKLGNSTRPRIQNVFSPVQIRVSHLLRVPLVHRALIMRRDPHVHPLLPRRRMPSLRLREGRSPHLRQPCRM